MNATILTTLLVATAVAAPTWMVRRKKQGLPFKARWLMTVGLLMTPIFLAKWLAPAAWMDIRTMPDLFWYLTVLPFVLGIAALGGGLLVFLAQILGAFFGVLSVANSKTSESRTGISVPNDPNSWYFGFFGNHNDTAYGPFNMDEEFDGTAYDRYR